MDKAIKIIMFIFLIAVAIYIVGNVIYENFLQKALKPASEKLVPYGIEILHLR